MVKKMYKKVNIAPICRLYKKCSEFIQMRIRTKQKRKYFLFEN